MADQFSPCLHCTRVRDPQNCENKNCKPWREWFIAQWETTRRQFRKGMDRQGAQSGVILGGQRYCPPHQIAEYLQTDPCQVCKLPHALCDAPCKKKSDWEAIQKEVTHELESGSHQ